MDVRSRRPLRFEALEDRIFLSTTQTHLHAAAVHGRASHAQPISGTLQIISGSTSNTQQLTGTGNLSPLGSVTVTGTFTQHSNGTGKAVVTLTGSQGAIDINVTVKNTHASQGSQQMHFTITGGSGSYAHASGQGTATQLAGTDSNVQNLSIHGTLKIA
jgi:hypothetical protein